MLRFLRACRRSGLCHLAECKAELDVTLKCPCVQSASLSLGRVVKLEKSEFNGPLCKGCMVVQHMVSAFVVMPVSSVVSSVLDVPEVFEFLHRLRLSAVEFLEEIPVYRLAVAVCPAVVNVDGVYQKAFMACHDVGKVS